MNDRTKAQKIICQRFEADCSPAPIDLEIGISANIDEGLPPLNGLRHRPARDTTGWYIWAGEDFLEDEDFFQPLHVSHLEQRCPKVIPYLDLGPGWRFLLADDYEDVWFDPSLLTAK